MKVRLSGPIVVLEHGALVHRLRPGWYTVSIQDFSTARNFHLHGPGVDMKTGLRFRGSSLWGVHLRVGVYRYGSDPGASAARSIRVG